jgi:allantoinase
MDLIVRGGNILTPTGFTEAAVAVEDGKIAAIGRESQLPRAQRTIDAKGKLVLPGMIDLHVHLRDPGSPEREDFTTGTSAAAAGGVTTIMDMPNTTPPTVTAEAFREKKKIGESKAVVDFALCGGVGVKSIDNTLEIAKEGASAFKTFMTSRFEELYSGNDATLLEIFRRVREAGLPCLIHDEDQSIVEAQISRIKRSGRTDPEAHTESRPRMAEAHGALKALSLAREAQARLYLCHTSIPEVVDHASRARSEGQSVLVETCAHYLLLTKNLMIKRGVYAKVDPPLRSEEIRQRMFDMFLKGKIDTLGSDHAPYTVQEKEKGGSNIFDAPSGSPGVETTLPVMLDCVNRGMLSLERLVQAFSEMPAKIAQLYPTKGCLQTGADADMVIVDMSKEVIVRADRLHSKQKYTLFDGWKCRGWPAVTIVRGTIVFQDGEIIGKPGYGQFQKPLFNAS